MMEWLPRGLPSIHAPIPICVPPKASQKRPATSPAPVVPTPHHLQSPSNPSATAGSSTNAVQSATASINHSIASNHLGGHSPSLAQQQHQAHQHAVAAAAAAVQVQQQLAGVPVNLNSATTQARGPFASALRNLAKQADIKEEEEVSSRERNERNVGPNVAASGVGATTGNTNTPNPNINSRTSVTNERIGSSNLTQTVNNEERSSAAKKRSAPSPQPVEKIARLTPQSSSAMQPELLARSGFQPYRSDERLIHPAGAFPLDAYSPFAGIAGMPPGAFINPAGLPFTDQMYLDQRFQLLRAAGAHPSHPHAALYPPMASPYASHLYSMIPSAALGLGPSLHDRIKLEEEHRARIAREEEREREIQREKEREIREMREQREREQREKEQREREQREKEQREKELKEKEAREREMREKEREARERERQQLLSASHHYSSPLYNPLSRNLLGSMIPHLNLGLRAPPAGLQACISTMSPYHVSNQRQSPHGAMGLNLGLPGLPGVPSLSHVPTNMPHHLQQAALGLTHPGFSAAALGLAHHSMNLTHPHMSPHHPTITSTHQMPSHSTSMLTTSAGNSPHGHVNVVSSSNVSSISVRQSDSNMITSSAPTVQASGSIAQPTNSLSTHMSPMSSSLYYTHHPSHLAAMHAAATGSLSAAPNQNSGSLQIPIPGSMNPLSFSTAAISGKLPTSTPVSSGNGQNGSLNNRTSHSPHAMRHHIANVVPQTSAMDKPNATGMSNSTHEPTTLDLTGSNSNSSNHAPSTVSNTESVRVTNVQVPSSEVNGVENSSDTGKDQEDASKAEIHSSEKKSPSSPTTTMANVSCTGIKDNPEADQQRSPSATDVQNRRHTSPGQGKISGSYTSSTIVIEQQQQQQQQQQQPLVKEVNATSGKEFSKIVSNHAIKGTHTKNSEISQSHSSPKPTSPLNMESGKISKLPPMSLATSPLSTATTTSSTSTSNKTFKTQTYTQQLQSTTEQLLPTLHPQAPLLTGAISTSTNPRSSQAGATNQSPDVVSTSGVTSTTSGTTSPPVVSSSTNIAGSSPQTNCIDEAAVSSATPTTSVQAETQKLKIRCMR